MTTKYGWITIEEGCKLPERFKKVPVKIEGANQDKIAYNLNMDIWFDVERPFDVLKPIAWYNVPPYNPEPIVNPHESTEGC